MRTLVITNSGKVLATVIESNDKTVTVDPSTDKVVGKVINNLIYKGFVLLDSDTGRAVRVQPNDPNMLDHLAARVKIYGLTSTITTASDGYSS